eukprot:6767745-Pyramimonas_sp.AAC.1
MAEVRGPFDHWQSFRDLLGPRQECEADQDRAGGQGGQAHIQHVLPAAEGVHGQSQGHGVHQLEAAAAGGPAGGRRGADHPLGRGEPGGGGL